MTQPQTPIPPPEHHQVRRRDHYEQMELQAAEESKQSTRKEKS